MVYTAVSWFKKTVTAVTRNILQYLGIKKTLTGVVWDKETATAVDLNDETITALGRL